MAKPVPKECENEVIVNGSFDEGTKGWKFIGASTGMKLVPGVEGDALSTVTRDQWFFGQAQNVNKDCFKPGAFYEASMDVKVVDYDGKSKECDPFNKNFTPNSCPVLALKLYGKQITTQDIGFPVGPWKLDGWNKIYGVFQASDDLYMKEKLEVYVTKAAPQTNVIIDNVSIKPMTVNEKTIAEECNELIKNGDAEIGDARSWHIKGNGSAGTIDIISPGGTGKKAFHHHGERKQNFNGMWQHINKKCMEPGSVWTISFKMKLLDASGSDTSCDKTQLGGDASCPSVMIESHTTDKGILTANLRNEAPGHWESGAWNEFSATFLMSQEHAAKDETSIFINNVPSSYAYKIDDISMTRSVALEQ